MNCSRASHASLCSDHTTLAIIKHCVVFEPRWAAKRVTVCTATGNVIFFVLESIKRMRMSNNFAVFFNVTKLSTLQIRKRQAKQLVVRRHKSAKSLTSWSIHVQRQVFHLEKTDYRLLLGVDASYILQMSILM